MHKPLKDKIVVIIADGEIRDYKYCKKYIRKADFIVCADGGLLHAEKLKATPDIIIGDFDSISLTKTKKIAKNSLIKKYPFAKNHSDTELAIQHAVKLGSERVILIGGFGKRIDHTLANIFSVGKYPNIVTLADEFAELSVHDKSFAVIGKKGNIISLLPFFSNVKNVSGKGFKYPISNLTLAPGSRGLSNELTSTKARVTFTQGKLLLIKVHQG